MQTFAGSEKRQPRGRFLKQENYNKVYRLQMLLMSIYSSTTDEAVRRLIKAEFEGILGPKQRAMRILGERVLVG